MLKLALATAYGASSALFALITVTLARAYSRLGAEELLGAAWGFALLTLSSVLGVVEVSTGSPRLAVAMYTGSSSTAAAGLFLLTLSAAEARRPLAAAAPLFIALSCDAAAAALGFTASALSRGLARVGFALLALAHAGRAASVLLFPGKGAGLLLLASEALRVATALVMAAYYAGGVLAGRGEEEQA